MEDIKQLIEKILEIFSKNREEGVIEKIIDYGGI
jgi:hypothetical protein